MKKRILNIICFLFTACCIALLFKADNTKDVIIAVFGIALFGGSAAILFIAKRKSYREIRDEAVVTIYENRKKMILLFAGCCIFIFVGVALLPCLHFFDDKDVVEHYFICCIDFLFFGFRLIISLRKIIKPAIVILISDKGIVLPKGITGKWIEIDWKEILAIIEYKIGEQKFISIYVENPEKYPVSKVANAINSQYSQTNINITANSTMYDHEELLRFLQKKLIEKQDNPTHFTKQLIESD